MMMNHMLMQLMAQRQKMQGAPPPVGMAPPQQPLQVPNAGNHMVPNGQYGGQAQQLAGATQQPGQALQPFMANGAYGQQAQQLAGLLGGGMQPGAPAPMRPPYQPGMFMPGFRPGIDQPIIGGGGLSGPKRGRIQEY